jgi:hypothetical protein
MVFILFLFAASEAEALCKARKAENTSAVSDILSSDEFMHVRKQRSVKRPSRYASSSSDEEDISAASKSITPSFPRRSINPAIDEKEVPVTQKSIVQRRSIYPFNTIVTKNDLDNSTNCSHSTPVRRITNTESLEDTHSLNGTSNKNVLN